MATRINKLVMCEFIRVEPFGKFTMLGVYPNNIIQIADIQQPFSIALYMEIETDEQRMSPSTLEVRDRIFGGILNRTTFNLNLDRAFTPPITYGPIAITVGQPTTLDVGFWSDSIWHDAGRISVLKAN